MRQKLELEMWDVEYGSEYRVLRCGGPQVKSYVPYLMFQAPGVSSAAVSCEQHHPLRATLRTRVSPMQRPITMPDTDGLDLLNKIGCDYNALWHLHTNVRFSSAHACARVLSCP
jgi:hypothetical protein